MLRFLLAKRKNNKIQNFIRPGSLKIRVCCFWIFENHKVVKRYFSRINTNCKSYFGIEGLKSNKIIEANSSYPNFSYTDFNILIVII